MWFAERPLNQYSPDEQIYLQITKVLFFLQKSEDSINFFKKSRRYQREWKKRAGVYFEGEKSH